MNRSDQGPLPHLSWGETNDNGRKKLKVMNIKEKNNTIKRQQQAKQSI